ncbi:(2Fe-2S)-binding protein [Mucisphaera calidilacus]|uniref:BFD-like [2Fe-2S] binding domain protein n=1 Tax=Mucisphaera calidilacus TaxID=2527982 RepID=A0A518BV55_9BACT|nr:(2Fe-2S)-binding protein [Mucisphaera calidilacus]QDU70827.1 BFD-like [2Fe-2S] binding domain protein [Mucisphaera calidilacus]
MNPDDSVCLCFRVSQRKIVNYCQREKPPVASLISECLSAGTGCGWCVPFLKSLHKQCAEGCADPDLPFSPEAYARQRLHYRTTGERPDDGQG